ncbi:FAD/NAD(P)-binding protein [Pontibacter vulgaris]|uniref:FAD/NAD(P)-binding protein n=1 Tax=Pontibacter vulgaris TaxID=2905679 RepID=UPI001FA80C46|nr:FAD/NAD(P)-binding protein [Pontibacter vulgaris]
MLTKTIAIIGGGLSGTLTALNLLKTATQQTTIYLVEAEPAKMHRGAAYSSALPFQPLNVPASAMSLDPDSPDDFYNWLQENQFAYPDHLKVPVQKTDFIPRFIFGDYVKERLQQAITEANENVKLIPIYAAALSVKRLLPIGDFIVNIATGESIRADKVVLALGNFAPSDVPIPNKVFFKSQFYTSMPWSKSALQGIKPDDALLLIGSSLTMIDLVGSLQKLGHKGKIYVVSRHGMLPQPFDVSTQLYPLKLLPLSPRLTALEIFKFVRSEIRNAEAKGYTWRSVLDALRPHLPDIWQNFNLEEKKRFLRHIKSYWEPHRHRMPASSAALIQQLQQQGKLEIIAARIADLQEFEHQARATIIRKGTTATEHIAVNKVINCTGPQADYNAIPNPLVKQLLAAGMLVPDKLKLGILTTINGTLTDRNNHPVINLYTLGPPRKSMLYESTALREIRQQAKELATELLKHENYFKRLEAQVA